MQGQKVQADLIVELKESYPFELFIDSAHQAYQVMPRTYTQIHIHIIFAVKYRAALIQPVWKERLQQYMTAITQSHHNKMLQINCMPDHIHMLIGLHPDQALSSLIQHLKSESSKWIKTNQFCNFKWQEGYGAFSYSKDRIGTIIRYIQNQELHHQKLTFANEFKRFLEVFDLPWEDRNLFEDLQ